MPRFFVNPSDVGEGTLTISGDDAYHIARSLRMAVGDELTVSDGAGTEYLCTLSRIRDEECECKIEQSRKSPTEPPVKISLFMAYPKGDKLEFVVQKAVELGASSIIPFESSRCVKRQKAEKADKQTERLSKIAKEAAKQCGRGILPEVFHSVSFSEMLERALESELALFCYEGTGTESLRAVLESTEAPRSVSVIVGCEGGFSEAEAQICKNKGARAVNLGPRILRCETAPCYVLSALSYFFELS